METQKFPKTITLPSGATVAQVDTFKGKHQRKATVMAGGDTSKYMPAIVCQLFKIEGGAKFMTMEDYDEMPGMDAMNLMELAVGNGTPPESGDVK
jgi:hypothetical protein